MGTKRNEATAIVTVTVKEKKMTTKDKAKKYIERCRKRNILPLTFEAVVMAYAAIGILKYDEAIEVTENYADTYIKGEE